MGIKQNYTPVAFVQFAMHPTFDPRIFPFNLLCPLLSVSYYSQLLEPRINTDKIILNIIWFVFVCLFFVLIILQLHDIYSFSFTNFSNEMHKKYSFEHFLRSINNTWKKKFREERRNIKSKLLFN